MLKGRVGSSTTMGISLGQMMQVATSRVARVCILAYLICLVLPQVPALAGTLRGRHLRSGPTGMG